MTQTDSMMFVQRTEIPETPPS